MKEANRIKAVEEIRVNLEERERLIYIVSKLEKLYEERKWDEYLDLLIKHQSLLIKHNGGSDRRQMVGIYRDFKVPDCDRILEKLLKNIVLMKIKFIYIQLLWV